MSRKLWVFVFVLCSLCLAPVIRYSFQWYQFDELNQLALASYRGPFAEDQDPFSTELEFRRQLVFQKL